MPVFFIVVGIVTLAFLVAMLVGWFDTKPTPDPVRPFGHVPLPEGGYTAADVDDVRFDAVMRGYKMSEVDEVLERMQHRQAELEEQVRALGGDPAGSRGRAVVADGASAEHVVTTERVTPGSVAVTDADLPEAGERRTGTAGATAAETVVVERDEATASIDDDAEPATRRGARRTRFGRRDSE